MFIQSVWTAFDVRQNSEEQNAEIMRYGALLVIKDTVVTLQVPHNLDRPLFMASV